jgi:hypothetical protein
MTSVGWARENSDEAARVEQDSVRFEGASSSITKRRKASSFDEYWRASKTWERHGLTAAAARALVHNGFLNLADLQGVHALELATIPRLGRRSLAVLHGLMGREQVSRLPAV